MTQAFVGFGANLGTPAHAYAQVRDHLSAHPGLEVRNASTLVRTKAVGGPPGQPDFTNGCLELETSLTAHELLILLLEVEAALGRIRIEHWGPRTVDLDLLLFGSEVIELTDLLVPHPRMHYRRFVIEPLAQIAANVVHPVLGLTADQLLRSMQDRKERSVLLIGGEKQAAEFAEQQLVETAGFAQVIHCSPTACGLECVQVGGRIIGVGVPTVGDQAADAPIGWAVLTDATNCFPSDSLRSSLPRLPVVDCVGQDLASGVAMFLDALKTPVEYGIND